MKYKCVECDSPAEEMHHVVPASLGGTFTVPLCSRCHGRIHGLLNRDNHTELTRLGIAAKRLREPEWIPGNRTNMEEARRKAGETIKATARVFSDRMRPEIERMQASGLSMNRIAAHLKSMGVPTSREGTWTAKAVSRVLSVAL